MNKYVIVEVGTCKILYGPYCWLAIYLEFTRLVRDGKNVTTAHWKGAAVVEPVAPVVNAGLRVTLDRDGDE